MEDICPSEVIIKAVFLQIAKFDQYLHEQLGKCQNKKSKCDIPETV